MTAIGIHKRGFPRLLRRFALGETAAAASEYAAIFAIIVIAAIVCVNVVGRHFGKAVASADSKLSSTSWSPFLGGQPNRGGPSREPDAGPKAKDEREGDGGYLRPAADKSEREEKPADRPEQKGNNNGVDKVRRIFKGSPTRPKGY